MMQKQFLVCGWWNPTVCDRRYLKSNLDVFRQGSNKLTDQGFLRFFVVFVNVVMSDTHNNSDIMPMLQQNVFFFQAIKFILFSIYLMNFSLLLQRQIQLLVFFFTGSGHKSIVQIFSKSLQSWGHSIHGGNFKRVTALFVFKHAHQCIVWLAGCKSRMRKKTNDYVQETSWSNLCSYETKIAVF